MSARAAKKTDALSFPDRAAWRDWLKKNHDESDGIWLAVSKKRAQQGVHYEDAVEEALCFGWIDSTVRRLDVDRFMQWYSPRKPTSIWSQLNKKRVDKLIAEGRMEDAGSKAIRAAKKSGSWERLQAVDDLEVPVALEAALSKNKKSRAAFEKLAPSHKKQFIYWISEAKRDETRERRVRETVRQLAEPKKSGI